MLTRVVGLLSLALLLIQVALLSPAAAQATTPTSTALANRYIIVLKDGGDARAVAAAVKARPDFVYSAALNGFAAELSAGQLNALQHSPWVASIEQDQAVTAMGVQNMDATGEPWGLDRIDQLQRPLSKTYTYTYTGAGVSAYIIDTGLQANHPDFGGRASNVYDALGGTGADCNGHGTHLAGIVGGTVYGVAKGVRLRGVRALDCNGSGSIAGVVAAIDWVRANAQKPAVANLSLGGGSSATMNTAVTNLANAGIFVAVAAGGSNSDACNYSPASVPIAYTVAAVDKNDVRASSSNYGPCVDAYAPGVAIKSDWLNSGTATLSGTSMSAAFVTGAAALYKQARGDAGSATVNAWLNADATPNVVVNNPPNTPNRLLYVNP